MATKHLKTLDKKLDDSIIFEIYEDPNPLGVEVAEVLTVLLDQEPELKKKCDAITDGKKRSLIYSINKIKDFDIQVQKSMAFLNQ